MACLLSCTRQRGEPTRSAGRTSTRPSTSVNTRARQQGRLSVWSWRVHCVTLSGLDSSSYACSWAPDMAECERALAPALPFPSSEPFTRIDIGPMQECWSLLRWAFCAFVCVCWGGKSFQNFWAYFVFHLNRLLRRRISVRRILQRLHSCVHHSTWDRDVLLCVCVDNNNRLDFLIITLYWLLAYF